MKKNQFPSPQNAFKNYINQFFSFFCQRYVCNILMTPYHCKKLHVEIEHFKNAEKFICLLQMKKLSFYLCKEILIKNLSEIVHKLRHLPHILTYTRPDFTSNQSARNF